MKVTLDIPTPLVSRLRRASEMRGLSIEAFIVNALQWHCPAYDNDAQYLREKIREIARQGCDSSDMMDEIEELVK